MRVDDDADDEIHSQWKKKMMIDVVVEICLHLFDDNKNILLRFVLVVVLILRVFSKPNVAVEVRASGAHTILFQSLQISLSNALGERVDERSPTTCRRWSTREQTTSHLKMMKKKTSMKTAVGGV